MSKSQLSNLLSDYTYAYREDQVAYEPLKDRAESRLLLVRKNPVGGLPSFEDCKFSELPKIVDENPELKKITTRKK
jgi:S-adenosylmethionine:tRNA-ribosyltransferase-isomerase (queuine synthetase)